MDFITSRIRNIRQQKKMTIKEVADGLGIEAGNYPRWEKRGENLTIQDVNRISKVFDVPVASILGITPEKQFIVAPIPQKPYTPTRIDFFAAAALQGLLSKASGPEVYGSCILESVSIAVSVVNKLNGIVIEKVEETPQS